jgi:hypothetical protein
VTAISVPDWLLQVAAILAAFTTIIVFFITVAKTRFFKWVKKAWRKLVVEPAKAEMVELIEATMIPHVVRVEMRLDQFEEKNDRQHAENKKSLDRLGESVAEHRLEARDQLFEVRQQITANQEILEAHFGEAKVRDERLTALEMHGMDVKIEMRPSDVPSEEHGEA